VLKDGSWTFISLQHIPLDYSFHFQRNQEEDVLIIIPISIDLLELYASYTSKRKATFLFASHECALFVFFLLFFLLW